MAQALLLEPSKPLTRWSCSAGPVSPSGFLRRVADPTNEDKHCNWCTDFGPERRVERLLFDPHRMLLRSLTVRFGDACRSESRCTHDEARRRTHRNTRSAKTSTDCSARSAQAVGGAHCCDEGSRPVQVGLAVISVTIFWCICLASSWIAWVTSVFSLSSCSC